MQNSSHSGQMTGVYTITITLAATDTLGCSDSLAIPNAVAVKPDWQLAYLPIIRKP